MAGAHHGEDERVTQAQRFVTALLLASLALAQFTVAYFVEDLVQHTRRGLPYYRAPHFFPLLSLLTGGVMALAMSVRALYQGLEASDEALPRTRRRPRLVVAVAILLALYIVIVPFIGYPLATLAFVATGLLLAGHGPGRALVAGILAAALLYVVFVYVLGVWFPEPRLSGVLPGR